MGLTIVKGLQSEIYVPVTPPPVWAPVTKALKDMSIAIASAAGIHRKDQERFNLAGDFTWRKIENTVSTSVCFRCSNFIFSHHSKIYPPPHGPFP